MWSETPITRLFGTELPIIQAPMAGETDRPALVAAVSAAGGLGSIGAAYDQPQIIREKIRAVRALTDRPFGVNLFAPTEDDARPDAIAHAQALLAPWRRQYGLSDSLPNLAMPDFAAQLAIVLEERPAVFSITFGSLPPERVAALKSAGIRVVGTATTVPEAIRLEQDGMEAIVAQGAEAGGHRGAFLGAFAESQIGLMALVPAMADRVRVPVIAAGGIMDGRGIAAALMLGAAGAQLGTAFLASPESGASAVWKRTVLAQPADATAVTRVYSGRPARGVRNRFMIEMEAHSAALPGFPAMNALTRAIRSAAAAAGDRGPLSLWAGQGAPLARALPAGELILMLARETTDKVSKEID
jgi:nitronate monooxygenase